MPEHDDMTGQERDPMDEAYLRAEQALDDEAARAARRAKVLAAVAQDAPAPAAARPPERGFMRRYGGWLAAAGVAGISVLTAEQVYRLSPQRQPETPPAAQPPASAVTATPAPPPAAASSPAPTPPRADRQPARSEALSARDARPPVVVPAPVAPPADIAPPPPLPLPPVEKPITAPSSPPPPVAFARPQAELSAPAPPPPPAAQKPIASPLAEPRANAGAADSAAKAQVQEQVTVTGSRRSNAIAAPALSAPGLAAPKPPDGPARLRDAAAAGRTAEIETLLAQGVAVDAADESGQTALMKSIEAGQRDAAALLRRRGASLDHKNRDGVSARDMAAGKSDPALDQALGIAP